MERMLADAEELLRKIAPIELHGRGVYLVTTNECGEEFYRPALAAYTCMVQDLLLQNVLERQGRWRGRGFAAVFDSNCSHFQRGYLRRGLLHAVSVHELGHAYADEYWLHWNGKAPKAFDDTILIEELNRTAMQLPGMSHTQRCHGPQFLRAALHLAYRAGEFGFFSWEDFAIGGAACGLQCDVHEYRGLLDLELRFQAREPLSMILKTPVPRDFQNAWERDVRTTS